MNKLVVMSFLLLISGCTQASTINETFNMSEVISTCDSLCNVDADAYCEEQRVIIVNGVEVTGTCRAFSRKGNVPGFNRCERFCREYDKSGTVCYINDLVDDNCDGSI